MSAAQIIFTVLIAGYSIWVIISIFSQAGKGGSLLYKFYIYTLVGLALLGIPLANSVISVQHIAIGVAAGVAFLAVQISIFGKSEAIGMRVWPWDAVFLMLNKRRRQAIALAKNKQWQEARAIFEDLLKASRRKNRDMICLHDITTCCASMGDFVVIESYIDIARKKYRNKAAFVLQLYKNLFEAYKMHGIGAEYVQQLEQYVNDNMSRLSKFKFTPGDGVALKGTDAANALVAWAKADAVSEEE